MLKRRVGLVVLVTLIALGVGFVVQAGDRKRARRIIGPVTSGTAAPLADDVITVCPQFITGGGPVICNWYAIKCINGEYAGPFLYMGACDLNPQTPCDNCYPGSSVTGPCQSVFTATDGFAGDLQAPVRIPLKGTAKISVNKDESANLDWVNTVHQNVVAKAQITGANGQKEEVYLQLVSMTTRPQHPLDLRIRARERMGTLLTQTGWQVQSQEKVDFEIGAGQVKPMPGHTRVVVVTFHGDDYVVVLKKL